MTTCQSAAIIAELVVVEAYRLDRYDNHIAILVNEYVAL